MNIFVRFACKALKNELHLAIRDKSEDQIRDFVVDRLSGLDLNSLRDRLVEAIRDGQFKPSMVTGNSVHSGWRGIATGIIEILDRVSGGGVDGA